MTGLWSPSTFPCACILHSDIHLQYTDQSLCKQSQFLYENALFWGKSLLTCKHKEQQIRIECTCSFLIEMEKAENDLAFLLISYIALHANY